MKEKNSYEQETSYYSEKEKTRRDNFSLDLPKKKNKTALIIIIVVTVIVIIGKLISYSLPNNKFTNNDTNLSATDTNSTMSFNEMSQFTHLSTGFNEKLSTLVDYCSTHYYSRDFTKVTKDSVQKDIDNLRNENFDMFDRNQVGPYIDLLHKEKDIVIKYAEFFVGLNEVNEANTKIADDYVKRYNEEIEKSPSIFIEVLDKNEFQHAASITQEINFWK